MTLSTNFKRVAGDHLKLPVSLPISLETVEPGTSKYANRGLSQCQGRVVISSISEIVCGRRFAISIMFQAKTIKLSTGPTALGSKVTTYSPSSLESFMLTLRTWFCFRYLS